jgi:hypothetical protein
MLAVTAFCPAGTGLRCAWCACSGPAFVTDGHSRAGAKRAISACAALKWKLARRLAAHIGLLGTSWAAWPSSARRAVQRGRGACGQRGASQVAGRVLARMCGPPVLADSGLVRSLPKPGVSASHATSGNAATPSSAPAAPWPAVRGSRRHRAPQPPVHPEHGTAGQDDSRRADPRARGQPAGPADSPADGPDGAESVRVRLASALARSAADASPQAWDQAVLHHGEATRLRLPGELVAVLSADLAELEAAIRRCRSAARLRRLVRAAPLAAPSQITCHCRDAGFRSAGWCRCPWSGSPGRG